MSTTTFTSQSVDLIYPGEETTPEGWYVSHWNAGQSSTLTWSTDNVYINSAGAVELKLSAAPAGSERPYRGGEVQSIESAKSGTWSWTAQVPELVSGSVFGLFTYRADHFNDPWIEFDMEFLGKDAGDFDGDGDVDVTKVRLNIHMEYVDASGQTKKITLEEANGWQPIIVDLGFDTTEGLHTYDIVVTDAEAIFVVDGKVVGRFNANDMGGVWTSGEMKGFTNLWSVDPSLEHWAGAYSGETVVATASAMDVRPGDLGGFGPAPSGQTIEGTAGDDALVGTDGDDTIYGHSGSDTLSGGLSNDRLFGGDGNDTLNGGVGADTLNGGLGRDTLYAGPGDGVRDVFVFASTAESPVGTKRDVVHDFISGLDDIDLSGIDANSRTAGDDLFKFSGTTAQANSVWYAAGRGEVILRADVNGDMKADFEIRLVGLKGMTADDFIL